MTDGIFTDEEANVLILSLLTSHPEGLTTEEVAAAMGELEEMRLHGRMVQMVLDRRLDVGWNGDETTYRKAEVST